MLTFIHYIGVHFAFGLLDCAHYNKDFVISRFIILRFVISRFILIIKVLFHNFYSTLTGLKNIVCSIEDFVV